MASAAGSLAIDLDAKRGVRLREGAVVASLFTCALISILTSAGIVIVLFWEAAGFFKSVSLWEFLFGTRWTPLLEPRSYGVLPLVCGTLLVVAGACVIAIPTGLACAIYMSQYASDRTRRIVKPVLEVLAGIPTVVYGYFALTYVTPLLQQVYPDTLVYNAASAGIVVGIMILPMIASFCDDALRAVPESLRLGALALGATRFEVTVQVLIPAALSGIIASFVLAISRCIGETMAVAVAAGGTPNLTLNPAESIQTMTGYIVQVSMGDTPHGTLGYYTIFAVGALLFLMTLGTNLIADRVLHRFRETYE
ncbi:MAG: phosphate ABC transporter permease subunit PstC [Planctomycetes bacterium]|nr:phosphate ABC transporter permease subunit PstC [Planctomycetota bacterium]